MKTLEENDIESKTKALTDTPYNVVVWNDPVNLMNYVIHTFMKVFGMKKDIAKKHAQSIHKEGKGILYSGNFERVENYVHQLQAYKIKATLEKGNDK